MLLPCKINRITQWLNQNDVDNTKYGHVSNREWIKLEKERYAKMNINTTIVDNGDFVALFYSDEKDKRIMNRTKIDWPGLKYTWNPITGCLRKCKYCYARRMNERFNKTPFDEITFHVDRLCEPQKLKKPSVIFVGSMSDIEYWPHDLTKVIIKICLKNVLHTFMFLSKSYSSYYGFEWPVNTMQGLTMELTESFECQIGSIIKMSKYPRPFLCFEPLLGELKVSREYLKSFKKIIVGAMTGPGKIEPKKEWIKSILYNAPKEKIYWKSNIKDKVDQIENEM
jgi:protein gp37